jgi:3-methyl-2-oxobutanoate hydroxymethyltransferase
MSKLGGFRVQGKDATAGAQLLKDALALEQVGCFAIVLEAIPDRVAQIITERLQIPTIGIGAGPHCDGQNLVLHDMVGLFDRFTEVRQALCQLLGRHQQGVGGVPGRVRKGDLKPSIVYDEGRGV